MASPMRLKSFALLASIAAAIAGTANAGLLYGSSVYTQAQASSEFGAGWGVSNLFDNNTSTGWAIAGYAGNNPQGRDQAWFSFTLDQSYTIDAIRLATRNASGAVDGIDTVRVWIGTTPFGVAVTNAWNTNQFLAANPSPTWTQTGFASSAAQTYTLGTPVVGRYVVVEIINSSDNAAARNMGLTEFVVSAAVPAPGALALLGAAGLVGTRRRR